MVIVSDGCLSAYLALLSGLIFSSTRTATYSWQTLRSSISSQILQIPPLSPVKNAGSTRWMDPELLYPEQFGFEEPRRTRKSDSYALGMAVLKALSGHFPSRATIKSSPCEVVDRKRPERGVQITYGRL